MVKRVFLIGILLLFFSLGFVFLLGFSGNVFLNFVSPTPQNGFSTTNTSFIVNIFLGSDDYLLKNDDFLIDFVYNWNGTNFSYYDNSLILMLNFDDYTRLNDSSRYNNSVSCSQDFCPLFNEGGKYGGAYLFDGSDDYLTTSFVQEKVSFSLWYKNSTQSSWNYLVNSNSAIYLNGFLSEDYQFPLKIIGNEVQIGNSSLGYFNGSIDEVRIWNRTLTPAEIQQFYLSNLQMFNFSSMFLLINQSKNSTSGLSPGDYNYQGFVSDSLGDLKSTDLRSITIESSGEGDTTYPFFSNYWDNNATLIGSGVALFNVSVLNTNGTVWLEINGTNITSTNLTFNTYNVSYSLLNGTYNYRWYAYGNGTSNLLNYSSIRSYVINNSLPSNSPLVIEGYEPYIAGLGVEFNVTANVSDSDGVDSVLLEFEGVNYTMNNISNKYYSNFTFWTNGTREFKIYANDSLGNVNNSEVVYVNIYAKNITFQIRTAGQDITEVKDVFYVGEIVNLTDPPEFNFEENNFEEFTFFFKLKSWFGGLFK